jgi:hypothetical protein
MNSLNRAKHLLVGKGAQSLSQPAMYGPNMGSHTFYTTQFTNNIGLACGKVAAVEASALIY